MYQTRNISDVLDGINKDILLPAIQREFVWDREQITRLFDSLMREYPIGSFLFWNVEEENKDNWEYYEFIKNYITDDRFISTQSRSRNVKANPHGQSKITLVLDGQQRLSSLYIGLMGSYTYKQKWKRKSNEDAWKKKYLFMNLLSNPDQPIDETLGFKYEFRFLEGKDDKINEDSEKKYWYKVGKILDIKNTNEIVDKKYEIIDEFDSDISRSEEKRISSNLSLLYKVIKDKEAINYFNEKEQDLDKVLDIFIRTNEGGTVLSKSDLLLSLATANWEGRDAREEITNFVDYLNKNLEKNNNFNKDFILKSCLVLSDLSVKYEVKNFTKDNLDKIEEDWENIKKSTKKAVRLVNRFGVHSGNMTSKNAIIPIANFIFENDNLTLIGDSPIKAKNRKNIKKWYFTSLLTGLFSGQSDNVLTKIRDVIQNNGSIFPVEEIVKETGKITGKVVKINEEVLDNILEFEYNRSKTFFALSLLYPNEDWGRIPYSEDHIFPRSKFKENKLRNRGFSEDEIKNYHQKVDNLANLQLITDEENERKRDKDFKKWIQTRNESFYDKHLIPKDEELLQFDEFLNFIDKREELIKDKLKDIINM